MTNPVHVIAATGPVGQSITRALLDQGTAVIPVVRSANKWTSLGLAAQPRIADLTNPGTLKQALADATRIISCAHSRFAPAILEAAPSSARYVFLSSTRRYTRWPNALADGVRRGEAAFIASGRNGVMLHSTMIYGSRGENNVQRLVKLLRRLPVTPLPNGGKSLVQPIYQDDVTRCVLAALEIDWQGPHTIIIAGPSPVRYAEFVTAVAQAAQLPKPRIVPVPAPLLMALAPLTTVVPFLPTIKPQEVQRLLEDKNFPIEEMTSMLGVEPVPLDEGLRQMFSEAA